MKNLYFYLYGKYMEFILWLDEKTNRNKSYNINPTTSAIIASAQQLKMQEGVNRIKHKVNTLVKTKTKDEYKRILEDINELLYLAEDTDPAKKLMQDALKNAYVYQEKDIKSDLDKAKMVETRINHYKELHKHKRKREILRKIREAEKLGNNELVNKLKEEWKQDV